MSKQVSLEELDEARREGQLVVDVRDQQEYSAGHISGVHLLPLGSVAARVAELPKHRPVYVVCQKGGRSIEATALMTEAGVDARSVAGGARRTGHTADGRSKLERDRARGGLHERDAGA
jgi:rhodanese-related sulfurtransferase